MNVALRPDSLNILSICTGGGGLDLGIELAVPSARSVCMVEREAFAVAQLVAAMEQGLMAPAPVWSDARTFDGRAWRGSVDGLIGGIPCQPHSLAGRKQGSFDARDLWSDARRIVVQSRCWFVLIENVAGMLAAGADEVAGAERVWRDLRKLGFAVEGGLFTAAEVGASHERERVFLLGVADPSIRASQRWRGAGIVDGESGGAEGEGDQRERRGHTACDSGEGMADAFRHGGSSGIPAPTTGDGQSTEPAIALDGVRSLVHAERTKRRQNADRGDEPDGDDSGRDQAPGGLGEPGALVVHADPGARQIGQGDAALCGRWAEQPASDRTTGRSPLFAPPPDDLSSWANVLASAPELEPAFRRVADGLASHVDTARVDRLRMLGNGVVPLQAAYALRTLATRLASRGSAGAAQLVGLMQ